MTYLFFFKQKTAYEMRISDWSSDVCSSDLGYPPPKRGRRGSSPSHSWCISSSCRHPCDVPFPEWRFPTSVQPGWENAFTGRPLSQAPGGLGRRNRGVRRSLSVADFPGSMTMAGTEGVGRLDRKGVGWGKGVSVRVD